MSGIVTEKDFPLQDRWFVKWIILTALVEFPLLILPLLGIVYYLFTPEASAEAAVVAFIFILLLAIVGYLTLLPAYLNRKNFHFSINDEYLTTTIGFLSKQQRTIHYGDVLKIKVTKGFLDRIVGLASVSIYHNSQPMMLTSIYDWYITRSEYQTTIPGVKPNDAEKIKNAILEKANRTSKLTQQEKVSKPNAFQKTVFFLCLLIALYLGVKVLNLPEVLKTGNIFNALIILTYIALIPIFIMIAITFKRNQIVLEDPGKFYLKNFLTPTVLIVVFASVIMFLVIAIAMLLH